ncbi:MAG: ATP-binding cassette domain-containing protein [Candidatus Lokiarchaeota archaeon]|nr:ATP-binding cassette domain-containing protein [Candidatus Lokiarchaeota archaeon]
MEHSDDIAIETVNLSKAFGDFFALKSLNLRVPKKSIFAFLGPNGAGKTTTIKLLLGLTRPTTGTGSVLGHDLRTDSKQIRAKIGYMAQNQRYSERMTPREILRFAARFFYQKENGAIDERVTQLLDLAGLSDKADRTVRGFSGGELQRLGIAQALINNPDLLILDEPAAGLDPQGREDVLTIMSDLREHATIFYSTHILDDVQRVSDMVAILNRGSLIACESIETLLADSDGIVYSITTKGDISSNLQLLQSQSWITSIQTERVDGKTRWTISVNDEERAEDELLRTLLKHERTTVIQFGVKEFELEEVFLRLVEEKRNDN